MESSAVKALIADGINTEHLDVQGEGAKFHVVAVSEEFKGLMPVKKQQKVYACLNAHIATGEIHAVTMELYTPDQWAMK